MSIMDLRGSQGRGRGAKTSNMPPFGKPRHFRVRETWQKKNGSFDEPSPIVSASFQPLAKTMTLYLLGRERAKGKDIGIDLLNFASVALEPISQCAHTGPAFPGLDSHCGAYRPARDESRPPPGPGGACTPSPPTSLQAGRILAVFPARLAARHHRERTRPWVSLLF